MNGSDRMFDHLSRSLMNGIAVCIWLLVTVQTPPLNAQDRSIEALQNETSADSVDAASKQQAASSFAPPTWSADSLYAQARLPSKLSRSGFEQALRDRFYGTFMFYRQLTGFEQNTVYKVYRRSPSIEVVREKVVGLLKKH